MSKINSFETAILLLGIGIFVQLESSATFSWNEILHIKQLQMGFTDLFNEKIKPLLLGLGVWRTRDTMKNLKKRKKNPQKIVYHTS